MKAKLNEVIPGVVGDYSLKFPCPVCDAQISVSAVEISEREVVVDVEAIENIFPHGDCQVRWVEISKYGSKMNIMCGHPLPCPKHTDIKQYRKQVAKAIAEEILKGNILKVKDGAK